MAVHFTHFQRFAGYIGFIAYHGDRQFGGQTGDKFRPDLCRINGVCRGAIDHKQHAVGLFNFLPRALDTNTFHFVTGFT